MVDAPKNLLKGNSSSGIGQNNPRQDQLLEQALKKRPPVEKKANGIGSWKLWSSFIIGIIIGILISWFLVGPKEESHPVNNESELSGQETEVSNNEEENNIETTIRPSYESRREPIVVSGVNEISVKDQVAGMTIEVELARFSVSGWIAIHEDNSGRENNLGNILGARRLDPGIHLTDVELLRATNSQGRYHAVLYVDDGDKQFDSSRDAPIKNADGKLIEAVFTTN